LKIYYYIAIYKFFACLVKILGSAQMRAVAGGILVAAGAVAQQSAYGQCMNSS
jgi:hypothetical protein